MPDQTVVGEQLGGPGTTLNLKSNPWGDTVVTQVGGYYFNWAVRGYIFSARTTSAATLDFIGTLTQVPVLWNKTPGVLVVPLILNLTPVLATVAAAPGFSVAVGYLTTPGFVVNSSYLSAIVNQTPVSTALGNPINKSPTAQFSGAATLGTAGIANKWFSLGEGLVGNATAGTAGWAPSYYTYDFQGVCAVWPGQAICFGTEATLATAVSSWMTLIYAELPLPASF